MSLAFRVRPLLDGHDRTHSAGLFSILQIFNHCTLFMKNVFTIKSLSYRVYLLLLLCYGYLTRHAGHTPKHIPPDGGGVDAGNACHHTEEKGYVEHQID